jgi:Ran GTPase-activating protein (RanGAP) involved in mRNA processing and transport
MRSLAHDFRGGVPSIEHLLLGNNICGDELGQRVADLITSKQSALKTWYIAGNRLTHAGIDPLCEALCDDTQVLQLWLKRNPLLPSGALCISNMLHRNQTLVVLDLVNTGLLDEGAMYIFEALHTNRTLQHLYVDGNGLTIASASFIGKCLVAPDCSLITLSAGCNRLGDDGTQVIADALFDNKMLRRLILASAGIGIRGARALATMLQRNTTLMFLDLGLLKTTAALGEIPNRIGVEGAKVIAEALKSNKTLIALNVFHNNIFQQGVTAFRDVFNGTNGMNTSVVKLELEQMGVPLNEIVKEEIKHCVRRNYLKLMEEGSLSHRIDVEEALNPRHLRDIVSVYRVNGSYGGQHVSVDQQGGGDEYEPDDLG